MADDDGYDVDPDDLEAFKEALSDESKDFLEAAYRGLAALRGFAEAATLGTTLPTLTSFFTTAATMQIKATMSAIDHTNGLDRLSAAAAIIATNYRFSDAFGAQKLNQIDGADIDKLFKPPPESQEEGPEPTAQEKHQLIEDLNGFFEEQYDSSKAINENATTQLQDTGYEMNRDGSVTVTVPNGGEYRSAPEGELDPDGPRTVVTDGGEWDGETYYDLEERRRNMREDMSPPMIP